MYSLPSFPEFLYLSMKQTFGEFESAVPSQLLANPQTANCGVGKRTLMCYQHSFSYVSKTQYPTGCSEKTLITLSQ